MRTYSHRVGEIAITAEESASLIVDNSPSREFNAIFRRIMLNQINRNIFIDYKWPGSRRLTVVCYCSTCLKHFKVFGSMNSVSNGHAATFQVFSDTPLMCTCSK